MKKMKVQCLRSRFCSIGLEFCRLLELSKGISLDFKFRCYGSQNQNNYLLLKKKGLLFKQNYFSKNNLKQYSLLKQDISCFEKELVIHFSYFEKAILFCF